MAVGSPLVDVGRRALYRPLTWVMSGAQASSTRVFIILSRSVSLPFTSGTADLSVEFSQPVHRQRHPRFLIFSESFYLLFCMKITDLDGVFSLTPVYRQAHPGFLISSDRVNLSF